MSDKVRYFLNCMGPVNTNFIAEQGDDWRGGRIDIEDGSMYGNEYTMPIMRAESWYALSQWLDELSSDLPLDFAEIIEFFEREEQHTIEWYKEPSDWVLKQTIPTCEG